MAITSGFYNSVNSDRLYTAEQLSSIFEGLIADGIYNKVGGALQVQSAGSGMTLTVATGRAWLNGAWIKNDAVHIIEIEASEVALSRYDAIVLRTDFSDDTRDGGIYVKKGVASSAPVYPELTSSEYIKEIPIAYIYVGKNVSEITQSNITDMRGSANCPWVTGLIEQVDTSTLWKQYNSQWQDFMANKESVADAWLTKEQADFLKWYNSIVSYMDENIEAKLAKDVLELQNKQLKATATLTSAGWTSQADGTYTQTVTVAGVTASNDIFVTPADTSKDAYVAIGCEAVSQAEDSIIFSCVGGSSKDIEVKVVILN